MWNPPRPGTEPTSPALAGGFLPTVPQGKSNMAILAILTLATQEHGLSFHFFYSSSIKESFFEMYVTYDVSAFPLVYLI